MFMPGGGTMPIPAMGECMPGLSGGIAAMPAPWRSIAAAAAVASGVGPAEDLHKTPQQK